MAEATRIEKLKEICNHYGVETRDFNITSAEDLYPYLEGEEAIPDWAAITSSGELTYCEPVATMEDAIARAIQFVDDSLYAESPIAICHIHSGYEGSLVPDWSTLKWMPR